MRLLLLSNSRNHGMGYLDHALDPLRELLEGVARLLFVPFALHDTAGYTALVRDRLRDLGLAVDRLEAGPEASAMLEDASALFVGGGNTFRLLKTLQDLALIEPIRRRVAAGMPYIGASAGTVITAPTLRTTNDMPIVEPSSFDALALLPFQINCHYLDADPGSRHMGETREQRIVEFLEENASPVVGLREGAMLSVRGDRSGPRSVRLIGAAGARIFHRGSDPSEHPPGSDLSFLLR